MYKKCLTKKINIINVYKNIFIYKCLTKYIHKYLTRNINDQYLTNYS